MACSELVTLKDGTVTSLDALRTLWGLEDRGFAVQPVGDRLQVLPVESLTTEDVRAIRRHRDELVALTRGCTVEL